MAWLGGAGLEALQSRVRWPVGIIAVAWVVGAAWTFSHGDLRWLPPSAFEPPRVMREVAPRIAVDLAHLEAEKLPPYYDVNAGLVAGVPTLVFVETLLPASYFEGLFASQFGPLDSAENQRKIGILVSTFNKFPLIHPHRPLLRAWQLGTLLHWTGDRLAPEALNPLPHHFLATRVIALTTAAERWQKAYADDWDPAVEAITEEPVATSERPPGLARIDVTREEADGETLRVSEGGAILVTSALMYPGWTVTVDGAPARPLTVDLALRGVALGPGPHTVVWAYRPPWRLAATLCTFAGILCLAGVSRFLDGNIRADSGERASI
jgi:hypothetical protein